MTDTPRYIPRYIRNTDAFGWQGADSPDGPWRSITPPQSSAPWQTTSPMDALPQTSADVSGVEVLSPQAQAVLDAAREAWITKDDPRSIAAAALRALVKTCSFQDFNTVLMTAKDVLAIANELEGV